MPFAKFNPCQPCCCRCIPGTYGPWHAQSGIPYELTFLFSHGYWTQTYGICGPANWTLTYVYKGIQVANGTISSDGTLIVLGGSYITGNCNVAYNGLCTDGAGRWWINDTYPYGSDYYLNITCT